MTTVPIKTWSKADWVVSQTDYSSSVRSRGFDARQTDKYL